MAHVGGVVRGEAPPGPPLVGRYHGGSLPPRTSAYAALPDKISIYRGPLERRYGEEPELLRQMIRRVVLHEIAHHFGISDERLHEIGRGSCRERVEMSGVA